MLTRVGDVARELGETEVTIRHWATQFSVFLGHYKETGQRRFSPRDVEVLREVKRLAREELYTLEGVKRQLRKAKDGT